MADINHVAAGRFLDQIEVAVGELPAKDDQNAPLVKQIIESVNGLRALLGVVRSH